MFQQNSSNFQASSRPMLGTIPQSNVTYETIVLQHCTCLVYEIHNTGITHKDTTFQPAQISCYT